MATLKLSDSVGYRCKNRLADVKNVRNRLRALGFFWVTPTGAGNEKHFVRTIRLFQSICAGEKELRKQHGENGKIKVKRDTHKWLAAQNAPQWMEIYGKTGNGWDTTVDASLPYTGTPYIRTNGGYGTSWIFNTIKDAARTYELSKKRSFPPMWVRDCAKEKGGNAKYHGSHETGIDIDLRLPLNPINGILLNPRWTCLETKALRRQHLYREAVEAQLKALDAQKLVRLIYYVDDTPPPGQQALHKKRGFSYVKRWRGHQDHMHVRIKPPPMVFGDTG